MKIDVEGHEFEVLRGAHGALSRFAIDVIGLEFGIHQVESRHFFKDFYTLFRDYGFTVYFARGGDLHKVTRYEYQYEVFTSNFQLIAAQERIAERLNTHGSWHDAALQQYQSSLQAKEAKIADLKMALSRMQTVYERSTSWRLTAPMRKVITAIRR